MMTFNDFVHKNQLRKKATSIIKTYQNLSSLNLNDVGICLRNGPFKTDIGIVNLHPTKGTHWEVYIHENYSDSYGCSPPQKLPKFF